MWQDNKPVSFLSNCHKNTIDTTTRKSKDGTKSNYPCSDVAVFYNKTMGGVDLSDQLVGLYDMDRKFMKWWRKVFYRLLMTSIVNSWIIFKEANDKKTMPYLDFLVQSAENLIALGRQNAHVIRRQYSTLKNF